jgi:transglutaminase/protease-like cytokinesis protein 3
MKFENLILIFSIKKKQMRRNVDVTGKIKINASYLFTLHRVIRSVQILHEMVCSPGAQIQKMKLQRNIHLSLKRRLNSIKYQK